jgi:DivIVA domain-containing protein
VVDNRVMTFFAPTSFGVTRFKPGYDMREVDAHLDACIAGKRMDPPAR